MSDNTTFNLGLEWNVKIILDNQQIVNIFDSYIITVIIINHLVLILNKIGTF